MLVNSSTPPPRILPAEPPDTWCPVAKDGKHHWVYAKVTGTPTRAAAHLHQCTLCGEQDEQPTESVARPAWSDICRIHGTTKIRGGSCDYCFDLRIEMVPVEPDDIEDAPASPTHLETT